MPPVALLPRPGSALTERIRIHLFGDSLLLEPDAPLTVGDDGVHWGGVDLETVGAILVEAPLVPWPQPLSTPENDESAEAFRLRATAGRERRALEVSALRIAARSTRVCNDPIIAADLTVSRALALDRLQERSVSVLPWRIAPAPSGESGWSATSIVAGQAAARSDGPILEVCTSDAPLRALLVVGREIEKAEERASLAEDAGPACRPSAAGAEAAIRAVDALGLDLAAVHVAGDRVALVDAAPDLAAWDLRGGGGVARALAAHIERTAASRSAEALPAG